MALTDNLPDKCKIQLRVRVRTGNLGGSKDTPTVVESDVPCWEQQTGASETREYEKQGIKINRKVYFQTNPGITEQHELVVTERKGEPVPAAEQVMMKVVSRVDPDANVGFGNLFRVFVEKTTTVND